MAKTGHFLSGCRFDVWVRLLWRHRHDIASGRRGTCLLLTLTSLLLWPFAGLERLLWARPIRRTQVEDGPVFVLGFWRMGTTYLHNVLVQDPQFAWFNPIDVMAVNNSRLLGKLLAPIAARSLEGARPMDNLDYTLDLPMEETFALALMGSHTVTDMLSFPIRFADYAQYLYVDEMPEAARAEYLRNYRYIIRKQTLYAKGRPLVLKSPDNTCRSRILREMYPNARFIHIHRDPYTTAQSAASMFLKQFKTQALSDVPDRDYVEDKVVENFAHVYRTFLADRPSIPKNRLYEVEYEDFCADPLGELRKIYQQLELPGFDQAAPCFQTYIDSLGDYRRNKYELDAWFQDKIEHGLAFYFDEYGYERRPGSSATAQGAQAQADVRAQMGACD